MKFGRNLQDRDRLSYGFEADFQIESYLRHQGISLSTGLTPTVISISPTPWIILTLPPILAARWQMPLPIPRRAFVWCLSPATGYFRPAKASRWCVPLNSGCQCRFVGESDRVKVLFCWTNRKWADDYRVLNAAAIAGTAWRNIGRIMVDPRAARSNLRKSD